VQLVTGVAEDPAAGVGDALQVGAVEHIEVGITVVVIIEDGDAGAAALQDIAIGRIPESIPETDPGLTGDLRESYSGLLSCQVKKYCCCKKNQKQKEQGSCFHVLDVVRLEEG